MRGREAGLSSRPPVARSVRAPRVGADLVEPEGQPDPAGPTPVVGVRQDGPGHPGQDVLHGPFGVPESGRDVGVRQPFGHGGEDFGLTAGQGQHCSFLSDLPIGPFGPGLELETGIHKVIPAPRLDSLAVLSGGLPNGGRSGRAPEGLRPVDPDEPGPTGLCPRGEDPVHAAGAGADVRRVGLARLARLADEPEGARQDRQDPRRVHFTGEGRVVLHFLVSDCLTYLSSRLPRNLSGDHKKIRKSPK